MAKTVIELTHDRASDLRLASTEKARMAAVKGARLLEAAAGGAYKATAVEVAQTQATGTLTLATSSGTVGGIINGVTVTVTWATSDTNTATLIAAAINASGNALVSNHVTASASGAVVTVTAKHPGHVGNAITLAASGTNVTASGARLTDGTSTTYTF